MPDAVVGTLRAMLTLDTASFEAKSKTATTAATKLEQGLGNLGKQTARLTPQAERMVKALSGEKMLASANSMTAAVQRIGGASKLTEAQQARVNTQLTEAIAKYRALGQTAPTAMLQLEQATRRVVPPTNALTTRMVALGAAIGSFAGMAVYGAVLRLGQGLASAAADGTKFTALKASFDSLTASIGQSGDAMLAVSRTATKGLIRDMDLMQSTNKAILLGLPVTSQEMATLSRTAVTLGRAMGLDATTALDNLIVALGRSSPLILDNLGLTVKLGEANEKYAQTLGKTANELTEAEKKIAFYRAAMDAALTKTEELGDIQLGVIDQLVRLGTTAANTATQMASGANESRTFAGALGGIADAADEAARRMDDLAEARRNLGRPAGFFGTMMPNRSNALAWLFGVGEIGREMDRLQAERVGDLAESGVQPIPGGIRGPSLSLPTQAAMRQIEEAARKLQQQIEASEDAVRRLFDELSGRNATTAVRQLEAAFSRLTPAQRANADIVSEVLQRYEALRTTVGTRVAPTLEALFLSTGTLTGRTGDLAAVMRAIPLPVEAATVSLEAMNLVATHGVESLLAYSQAAEAVRDKLGRLAMLPPPLIQSEDATGEADRIARAQLNEQLEARRQQIADFWQRQAGHLEAVSIGRLGSLFVGQLGHDITGELRAAADEAHQAFLRLQRSAGATAQELTLAFQRWRDAEERASFTFGERWKQFWGGLKQSFLNVLDEMLGYFIKHFLGGLVRGIAGARLGQTLGNALAGAGAGAAIGGGASIAASVAGVEAAALGGGAAGGGSAIAALATNPVTIGIAGTAALLSWGIGKKGWFRGGEEALQVNPKRDQFLAQFGGHARLAALLTKLGAGDGGGMLMQRLNLSDSLKDFRGVQSSIAGFLAPMRVKQFNLGGFVPPNVTTPAILHGGRFGEDIVPRSGPGAMGRPVEVNQNVYLTFNSQALNGDGVTRVWREEILPRLKFELRTNQNDLLTTLNQVKS